MILRNSRGITLIEVVMVVVIAGILAAVAMRSASVITETGRVEDTKREMEELAYAIVGNPDLKNNGVRSDFGFVGDNGKMPASLGALYSDPGGQMTWNGPYIKKKFLQISDDYQQDAWGVDYEYTGDVTITSTGSGSDIVRKFGNSTDDFLENKVTGVIFDLDGTPPGIDFMDSVEVVMAAPNGNGNIQSYSTSPDAGGFFTLESVPIGNHDLYVIYEPDDDTLKRFVSVIPNSVLYNEYRFPWDIWTGGSGHGGGPGGSSGQLQYVPGSGEAYGSSCNMVTFDITNTGAGSVSVSSIILDWAAPSSHFEMVRFGSVVVYNRSDPRMGPGETAQFSQNRTVSPGDTVTVTVQNFRYSHSGSSHNVDMGETDITVTFSDGSYFTFDTGECDD